MPPTCMSQKRKAAYTVLVQNQNNAKGGVTKLLRRKNVQATARSESAIFLRTLCGLPARTLKRKKSKIFTARS